MTYIKLITDPAAVTPEWLTEVLRASRALTSGRVESVSHELFGAGMVGDNARFHLSYDGGEGPATVVGKFPTADEASRGASSSEERRVGRECVGTCSCRGSPSD